MAQKLLRHISFHTLPLSEGMHLVTALAAPVEEGMMLPEAHRPPRQSLLDEESTTCPKRDGRKSSDYKEEKKICFFNFFDGLTSEKGGDKRVNEGPRLLGRGHGVHGGHEAHGNAELVVDGLDHGGEAVGGAGCAGDSLHVSLVLTL